MSTTPVRVRFAPSPTGDPHIGSIRTALFNWLFARHYGGAFILRVEDTDQTRLVEDSVENIYRALDWLGLTPDESPRHGGTVGPYQQSERLRIYQKHVETLLEKNAAYYCFCTPERLEQLRQSQQNTKQVTRYDGHCLHLSADDIRDRLAKNEPHVIRLRVPEQGNTIVNDVIRGVVVTENSQIDHQVLLKSDGFPTYHLANVVDDHLMGITHVIRAEEWLPSTPKHILLYQAFGWEPPQFLHLSMIIGEDRSKLSKRHGATSALEYQKLGYLPEAIITFLALLGWNPKTDQEIFTTEELIAAFSEKGINKSPAVFNVTKLNAINAKLVRTLPVERVIAAAAPFLSDFLSFDQKALYSVYNDRVEFFSQLPTLLAYLRIVPDYSVALLIGKSTKEKAFAGLTFFKQWFETNTATAMPEKMKENIFSEIEKASLERGSVLWPARVAITGQEKSPDVFASIIALGKAETMKRIDAAMTKLK